MSLFQSYKLRQQFRIFPKQLLFSSTWNLFRRILRVKVEILIYDSPNFRSAVVKLKQRATFCKVPDYVIIQTQNKCKLVICELYDDQRAAAKKRRWTATKSKLRSMGVFVTHSSIAVWLFATNFRFHRCITGIWFPVQKWLKTVQIRHKIFSLIVNTFIGLFLLY